MSTMMTWYREGGPVMNLISLVGLVGLAIFFERLYVIVVRAKNNSRPFIERVIQLVRAGRVDEAIKECAGSNAAIPDIGLLILRSRSRDESDLQNVAAAASLAVVPNLTRRLQYLSVLATALVLLGVFGTLYDLRRILSVAGGQAAAEHAGYVAAGIAAALSPTAFALLFAIVLVVGRGYLVGQSEFIIEQIHEFSARLINALIDRPDVRLGHR